MDYERLGKFIKQKRKEKGMTQQELAKAVNLSRQVISDLENGKFGSIRFVKLERIMRVLGYDFCLVPFNPFRKEEPFMCKEDWEFDDTEFTP
jgi:transcriptional regulator with XRE-family HTH domain